MRARSRAVCAAMVAAVALLAAAQEGPAATITVMGLVVDERSGLPLADLAVATGDVTGWKEVSTTGPDGHFVLDIQDDVRGLRVSGAGYANWTTSVDLEEGRLDLGVIEIGLGRAVSGRVFDSETGAPIIGARVAIKNDAGKMAARMGLHANVAEAGTDGVFQLDGLVGGEVELFVTAEGYRGQRVPVPRDWDVADIAMGRSSTISGRLVVEGVPAEDVREGRLWLWDLDNQTGRGQPFEADGTFTLTNVEPGRYQLRAASAQGMAAPREVRLGDDQHIEGIDLIVPMSGRVAGRITGLAPAETVTIAVVEKSDAPAAGLGLVGGPRFGNGEYELFGVPDGRVRLAALTSSGRRLDRPLDADGSGDRVIDFQFSGGAALHGTVTSGGRTVSGVEVYAQPHDAKAVSAWTMTDANGRYELDGLDEGAYTLRARGQVFGLTLVGQAALDIALGPFSLRGTVEAGGPLRDARVVVTSTSLDRGRFEALAHVDRAGAFRLDGLPEGQYNVRVSQPGYAETSRDVYVASVVDDLRLHLARERRTD